MFVACMALLPEPKVLVASMKYTSAILSSSLFNGYVEYISFELHCCLLHAWGWYCFYINALAVRCMHGAATRPKFLVASMKYICALLYSLLFNGYVECISSNSIAVCCIQRLLREPAFSIGLVMRFGSPAYRI